MNDRSAAPRPEDLLLHAKWVRRIAAHLVVDAARADDLAQQTLLTALAQPPLRADHPRAWLASVARSLARKMHRTDERRAQHESAATPPEPPPAAHEVVTHAQTQHDVVAALLALDEPYRTALLLRFFEDRPPRTIAKETRVPVETVRTRIRRGLELLRAELVRRRGGGSGTAAHRDSSAWAVALVGLLDSGMRSAVRRAVLAKSATTGAGLVGASTFAGVVGVLAMTTKLKLAVAAVVVAGGAFAVVRLCKSSKLPRNDSITRTAHDPTELPAPASAEGWPLPAAVQASRAPESDAASKQEASTTPAASTCTIDGIVRTSRGTPSVGASVLLEKVEHSTRFGSLIDTARNSRLFDSKAFADANGLLCATTDSNGSFRFEGLPRVGQIHLAAAHRTDGLACAMGVALESAISPRRVEITLIEGVVLRGRVVDRDGSPIAGASVGIMESVVSGESSHQTSLVSASSDDEGNYQSWPLPFRGFELSCSKTGFALSASVQIDLHDGEHDHFEEFRLERATSISGRIVTVDGSPALLERLDRELLLVGSERDPSTWRDEPARLGRAGTLDRHADRYTLVKDRSNIAFISLWCDAACLGFARLSKSGAAPDLVIDRSKIPELPKKWSLTLSVVAEETKASVAGCSVEASLLDGWYRRTRKPTRGVTDGDGKVTLRDLDSGELELVLRAPDFAPRLVVARVDDASARTDLRIELLRPGGAVRGRVVDENGRPLGGATLSLLAEDGRAALPFPDYRTVSASDGTFVLKSVPEGSWRFVAELAEFAPAVAAFHTDDIDDGVNLVLKRGATVLICPAEPEGSEASMYALRVVDADGVPVIDQLRHGVQSRTGGNEIPVRLATGTYTVEVIAPRFRCEPVRFTAAPDLRVAVRLVTRGADEGARQGR